jgi:hypothetical protein
VHGSGTHQSRLPPAHPATPPTGTAPLWVVTQFSCLALHTDRISVFFAAITATTAATNATAATIAAAAAHFRYFRYLALSDTRIPESSDDRWSRFSISTPGTTG